MSKKVYVEAEVINGKVDDLLSHVRFHVWGKGGVTQEYCVDNNKIHDIPTSIEIPEWTVDLIEDERFDGHNLFGLLSNLISRKKFDELSAEEGTKLQKDFALAVVTNNYTVKKDPVWLLVDREGDFLQKYEIKDTNPTGTVFWTSRKKDAINFISSEKAEQFRKIVGGKLERIDE